MHWSTSKRTTQVATALAAMYLFLASAPAHSQGALGAIAEGIRRGLDAARQEQALRQQEEALRLERKRQDLLYQQLELQRQQIQQERDAEDRRQWEEVRQKCEQLLYDSRWRWFAGDEKAKHVLSVLNKAHLALGLREARELPAVSPPEFANEELIAMCKDAVALVTVGSGSRTPASGTAFFISPDGLLLTCAHVVQASYLGDTVEDVQSNSGASVRTSDGRVLPASCFYCNSDTDTALLYVSTQKQPWLPLASGKAAVGSEVLVLGYPLGADLGKEVSATRGIVSSVRYSGTVYQLDAAVNPGNSGGPVLNKQGQVVGIAFAKMPNTEGVNFAIAADSVPTPDNMLKRSPLLLAYLRVAIVQADVDRAGTLLKSFPELIKGNLTDDGWNCLHLCAKHGRPDMVPLFLQHGADINARAVDGRTPLMIAAWARQKETAKELLLGKCDIDAKDTAGRTALEALCRLAQSCPANEVADYVEMASALVDAGADMSLSEENTTALGLALRIPGAGKLAQQMIQKGADVNCKDGTGMSPLFVACLYSAGDNIVKALVEAGGDVNAPDNDGETPLFMAAQQGDCSVLKTLLTAGARADARSRYAPSSLLAILAADDAEMQDGRTPLAAAARMGRTSAVKLLLAAGADVNIPNSAGLTPLHLAAAHGHTEVIGLLLRHGAKTAIRDKVSKLTPLGYARKKKQNSSVQLLKRFGAKQ